MKEILFELSNECFIGSVRGAADAAKKYLEPLCDEIDVDPTGSITGIIRGKSKHKILLEAHIDEIGMAVTGIEDGGFIRAAKVGGVDIRTLPSAYVNIHGKKTVKGVFTSTPPHLSKNSGGQFGGLDEIFIDTGLDNAADIISEGDYVTFDVEAKSLCGDFVTGKSMDDRSGCVSLIRAAELIRQNGTPENTVILSLCSGEELGNRGAGIAAYRSGADEAVAVDVSFGLSNGAPENQCGKLGEGAMLGISPVLSKEVTARLKEYAEKYGIKYQNEVMGGRTSTDADVISLVKSGIPCGLLSIPLRYMHTPVEVVKLSDIESVAQLLFRYVSEQR